MSNVPFHKQSRFKIWLGMAVAFVVIVVVGYIVWKGNNPGGTFF